AADPAHPLCAAHLHTPPLALAAAADLAASALNPSMDSWDQAPAASALEALVTAALAAEVYPDAPHPDALVTTGGTESNQLALLLARERLGPTLRTVVGANAHHSFRRAAWLLGLPEPVVLPTPR
ncbi:aspartate aminotransferase family protein, partial [Streptomyces sp. SID6041]|nr:aspartate aminotransferase family protein [Streptomyces sp. SID6041]